MKTNLAGRLALGFGVTLLLLGANALVAHLSVRHLIRSQNQVVATYQILQEIETDVTLAKDVETDTRGYVITSNKEFLRAYTVARGKVRNRLEPLYSKTKDDPEQQRRVLQLAALVDRKLQASGRQIALVDLGRKRDAERLVASGENRATMDAIRAKANEIRQIEERRLDARTVLFQQASRRANITIWLSMAFSLWLLALVYNGLAKSRVQEERLAKALHEVKRVEALRDSLNAMLVHDLRAPLTVMLGPLEMLQAENFGQLGEMQREIVGMSLDGSRRLLRLVNELLDIAKMEAGEMKVMRKAVAPADFVAEAVRHLALGELDGAAKIETEVAAGLAPIAADAELLQRVLMNLLGNAIKFTPPSGAIRVGARDCIADDVLPARLRPHGGAGLKVPAVLFQVRDTGEGIPAADLDRIFDKFGQVESRQSGLKNSTGLGLTFCKLAVEAHGGLIWVESEPGEGSVFCFTVPRMPEAPLLQSEA